MYAEIMCNEDTDTTDCCFQFNQLYADLNDQENDVSLVLNRRCTFKRASNSVSVCFEQHSSNFYSYSEINNEYLKLASCKSFECKPAKDSMTTSLFSIDLLNTYQSEDDSPCDSVYYVDNSSNVLSISMFSFILILLHLIVV